MKKVKCPLCQELMPLNTITEAGCITCSDERAKARKDRHNAFIPAQRTQQEVADAHYQRFLASVDLNRDLAEERERKAQERAEQKRVQALNREQGSVALARRSLLHYIERRQPTYKPGWAHEVMANELERFVQDIADKKSPRLILSCCSRLGKSELASNSLPAWALGQHPEWKFIITSYSDKLPSVFSRSIRDQLRSDEYRKVFPNGAVISADDSSVMNWSTTQGGGVRAVGVGGSLMGFGTDVLILDDIVKDSVEADNPEAMNQSFDFFSSVAYSRLLPGAGVLIIQQRMSTDDLIGRVIQQQADEEAKVKELRADAEDLAREAELGFDDQEVQHMLLEAQELEDSMDKWRVVEFPALAKQDEYYDRDAGELIGVPPGTEPNPNWKPLRKIGEAIHPERYTRSYYLKIKRSNPRRFSSMFQLDPIADGAQYFDVKLLNRYSAKKRPKHLHIVTAWDLAIGTKQHNDYTVGIALGMDPQRRVYLLDRIKGKFGDIRQVSDMIINFHVKWDSSITGIEKNHIEQSMGPILRSRMHELGTFITLAEGKEALKPINDKKVRARTLQGWVQAGLIYVPEGEDWDSYISALSKFGSSNHDDDIDATAWAAILLARNPPPVDPSEERKKSAAAKAKSWWDEMINEMTGGQSTGYMES